MQESLKGWEAVLDDNKKMVKPGQIIGLIIGIIMIVAVVAGMMMGEASLSDSKGRMIGIGIIVFGTFMIIVNIIGMMMGTDDLLAAASTASAPSKQNREEAEESKGEIRCRFCGKKYSAEYNGCPYCKKK